LSYWAETVFTLWVTVTLTFDLLTSKSKEVFYSIRDTTLWSLKALAQRVLKLFSGNGFHPLGHCDLDLWSTNIKINRGLLPNNGFHPMKFEGSGTKGTQVIERKRSVTDGQTDKAKTICLPQLLILRYTSCHFFFLQKKNSLLYSGSLP